MSKIDRCSIRPLDAAILEAVAAIPPRHREPDPRRIEDPRGNDQLYQRARLHALRFKTEGRQRMVSTRSRSITCGTRINRQAVEDRIGKCT